ncbi:sulfatase [Coraliomargarita sinensis]|uniref:sulfatase n=1 Tax=Coraliomargarita sinensis TaxID=2174842 RepID=UPI001304A771|nr:sulfatase [Coraliomargarita sinensis]
MLASVGTAAPASAAYQRPNILFLCIDDLAPQLGAYGAAQVKSPHMDRLAEAGLRFDRAYCQVPVCGASRVSLMTGMLPTSERFTNYRSKADEDVPHAPTLPEVFRKAGYTTISNGKVFHSQSDTAERSWSEPPWRPEGWRSRTPAMESTMARLSERGRGLIYEIGEVPDSEYTDGRIAARTIEDLQRLKDAGEPFMLFCGFYRPHLPFYAPKKYWDLYDRESIELADNRYFPRGAPHGDLRGSEEFWAYHHGDYDVGSDAFHRMMRHGYLASVSYVDQLVGNVMAELERLGLRQNTIIVLWGDHGFHLGEHDFWGKHNTMHLSTRVPLILSLPNKQLTSTSALVESSDLFPTLCELAGVAIPDTVQGKSLVPLLKNPGQNFREAAYSRFGVERPGLAVITERYNYTWYAKSGAEMLYDLEKDPGENRNVAGDPAYAEALKEMRALLVKRRAEAGGPQQGAPKEGK